MLKCLKVFVSNLWLCQPFPGTFGSSPAFRKAAAMLATVLVWSDQYRRLQKKLTLKNVFFFCEVKQPFRFCDFVFVILCPFPGTFGSSQASRKAAATTHVHQIIRSDQYKRLKVYSSSSRIWLEKNIHLIKIIGRPLNLLFLTFDFFSLRASSSLMSKNWTND